MTKLIDRLKKYTKGDIKLVKDADFYSSDRDHFESDIYGLNLALSGQLDVGMGSGILTIAAKSKHFKTLFGLYLAKAYMDKYDDAVILFLDTEGGAGSGAKYFDSVGIDTDRVLHVPCPTLEDIAYELVAQEEHIKKEDKVFIFLDSLGLVQTKKEIEDLAKGDQKASMGRNSQIIGTIYKALMRITRHNDIPSVVINRTYSSMDMYSPDTIYGGEQVVLCSEYIWRLGKRKVKEGKEIKGYEFVISVDKSRACKDTFKIPIKVTFEDSIDKYSGLFELLKEFNIVESNGAWFKLDSWSDKKFQKKAVENDDEFWSHVFENTEFKQKLKEQYQL